MLSLMLIYMPPRDAALLPFATERLRRLLPIIMVITFGTALMRV